MDKPTSMLRLQVWAERVRECYNSGMTVKEWCGQNNINLKTYYYWQRKVRSQIYALRVSGASHRQRPHHVSMISLHFQPSRYPDPGIFTRISSCVQPVSQ